jgi:selenocysteine lyase/cysteine desulfurase
MDIVNNNIYYPHPIDTPYGKRKLVYADYTASGLLFKPIEVFIQNNIYPYYANTHSNAFNGRLMLHYINLSKKIIKKSVNANENDIILFTGNGCSAAITHLIHILNIKKDNKKYVFYVTSFEHNSNFLPWKKLVDTFNNCTIEIINTLENGLIDIKQFTDKLKKYDNTTTKIVSFSAGSNINGIIQNTSEISIIAHKYNAFVFFDYAATGPYVDINMHKKNNNGDYIDAIFISPHKFLGGPGSPGLLIVNNKISNNKYPFYPSGGTVRYCSNKYVYYSNLETRESGGTPNIIGCIKIGLVFKLKNKLQKFIHLREKKIVPYVIKKLLNINNLKLLNPISNLDKIKQIPVFSFMINKLHYNFVVVLLNDLFGIQSRGGVSCSGIYAKELLKINEKYEKKLISTILNGEGVPNDYGWCRITFHYTMPPYVIKYIIKCINFIANHGEKFINQYVYDKDKNIWYNKNKNYNFEKFNLDITLNSKFEPCDCIISENECKEYIKNAYKIINLMN